MASSAFGRKASQRDSSSRSSAGPSGRCRPSPRRRRPASRGPRPWRSRGSLAPGPPRRPARRRRRVPAAGTGGRAPRAAVLVTVADHGPLALVRHRDGDRASASRRRSATTVRSMPSPCSRLSQQYSPYVVVPEGGGQRRPQPEPGQGGGHVGDTTGAGPHAARPGLGPPHGGAVQPREDDVEEDGPRQIDVAGRDRRGCAAERADPHAPGRWSSRWAPQSGEGPHSVPDTPRTTRVARRTEREPAPPERGRTHGPAPQKNRLAYPHSYPANRTWPRSHRPGCFHPPRA